MLKGMHPLRQNAPLVIVGAFFLFCAVVWSIILGPYFYGADGKGLPSAAVQAVEQSPSLVRVSALLASSRGPLLPRSKTVGCIVSGPLPDRACNPGSVFAGATVEKICVAGYSKSVRSVSTKLRKQLFAAYGVEYSQAKGAYELDHLIPLALGGDNSAANLFPEAAEPSPGFKEKDVVEVYLQEEVCAGKIDLAAAQTQIASDWIPIYNALDKSDIARIRQKYASWAN